MDDVFNTDELLAAKQAADDFNRDVTPPLGFPFLGAGAPSEVSHIAARDFIQKGRGGYIEIGARLAELYLNSRIKFKEIEIKEFMDRLAAAEGMDQIGSIVEEAHARSGGKKEELEDLYSAFGAILSSAKNATDHFVKLSSEQNPLFAYLSNESARLSASPNMPKIREALDQVGWDQTFEQEYPRENVIEDIKAIVSGRRPSKAYAAFCAENISNPVLNGDIANFIRTGENFPTASKKKLEEILTTIQQIDTANEVDKIDRLRRRHDEALATARHIALEAFYPDEDKHYSIADAIPLVTKKNDRYETYFSNPPKVNNEIAKKGREIELSKKAHFEYMLSASIKRLKKGNQEFEHLLKQNPGIEFGIIEDLSSKLFSAEPDQNILAAIYQVDTAESKIEKGIPPGRRQEEQLGKIIEDTIYNHIAKKNGAEEMYASLTGANIVGNGIVDVRANAASKLYYSGPGSATYTAQDTARQLVLLDKLFEGVSNGKLTRDEFENGLNNSNIDIIGGIDKKTISENARQFYSGGRERIVESRFGISRDKTEREMNANSFLLQNDARYIHKKMFGDSKLEKMANKIGLTFARGQEFTRCISSARHSTVKTHSSGHETKACIEKLIDQYKKDSEDVIRNISNPLAATSGISGLMLIMSIFAKARARQLQRLSFVLEMERAKQLEFLSEARSPMQNITYTQAIRQNTDGLTSIILDKADLYSYQESFTWANHMHEMRFNRHFLDGEFAEKLTSAITQEAKAETTHEAVMDILRDSGMRTEFMEMLDEDFASLKEELSRRESGLNKQIIDAKAEKDTLAVAKLHGELASLRMESLKAGVFWASLPESVKADPDAIISAAKNYCGISEDENGLNVIRNIKEMIEDGEAAVSEAKANILSAQAEHDKLLSDSSSMSYDDVEATRAAIIEKLDAARANLIESERSLERTREAHTEIIKVHRDLEAYLSYAERGMNDAVAKNEKFYSPFVSVKEAIIDRELFVQKNRGVVSTPFFAETFDQTFSRMQIRMAQSRPKNTKTDGEAFNALRAAMYEMQLQQVATKNKTNTYHSHKEIFKEDPDSSIKRSTVKMYTVDQTDPKKIQVIAVDKKYEPSMMLSDLAGGISIDEALKKHDDVIINFERNIVTAVKHERAKFLAEHGVSEAEIVAYIAIENGIPEHQIADRYDAILAGIDDDDIIKVMSSKYGNSMQNDSDEYKKGLSVQWRKRADEAFRKVAKGRDQTLDALSVMSRATGINVGQSAFSEYSPNKTYSSSAILDRDFNFNQAAMKANEEIKRKDNDDDLIAIRAIFGKDQQGHSPKPNQHTNTSGTSGVKGGAYA